MNLFEAAAAQAAQGATPGRQPATAAPSADTAAQFAMLRQSPQFQQMRQLIMAQPELLQPLLQQLGQSSPELMQVPCYALLFSFYINISPMAIQLIQSHPEEFLSLLGGDAGDFEDAGGEEGEGGQYVTISPEDDAAINRLVALGFDRNQAAEAFLACDKNEELAANYLFDQMGNDF